MVKQNARGAKNTVGLAVIDSGPMGKELGDPIRAARVKGSVFRLRYGLHLAEHFRGRGLIEAD